MIALQTQSNEYAIVIVTDRKASVYIRPHFLPEDTELDARLCGQLCTRESVLALAYAIRDWLRHRLIAGQSHDGLSAFIEQARVEYLQPVEAA